ncbi:MULTISPECIES: peptidase S10 [unclassified Mesorhizobium]|uniref:S10 family peptidase n=1 Tax=unclassified Mesorhizobium TaxID=325217 RepID=UPI00112CD930|nr:MULTISPECIES: peptidase S10 [unclassified Mesorhizobium]MBZ9982596.1 peptidase S10 [Mesorhizobium sp. BR-1-1-8]TPL39511.1 peptidase S10 [Mesorhizobium sp. B2-4-8]TPL61848.1 peptidase S10 [Mesorhizobium sp. B2-4-2]TPL68194.1 peptidase S10 [Mesorhizobium sp. B2-4-1]
MPFKLKLLSLILLMLAAFEQPVLAETPERPAPTGGVLSLLPPPQVTSHSITVAGRKLDYQAKTGTLSLLSGKADVTAEIFYVAYTLRPPADAAKTAPRPITFVFNGGPGAASAYLHLGALGPRIITTGADGEFLPPPQKIIDNPDSWLDMTDLVFVDPVGTGYSREAPGQNTHDFWGVNQDASSIGAFIRLYLAQNGRSGSPLFLAGESYGGFRAALLARTLQEDVGLSPSGIVLISPALEFMLVQPDEFEPLHWALELPSLASVRLSADGVTGEALRAQLAAVERYALGDYLTALASGLEQGGRLASQRVAEITGLPLDLVQRNFARIPTSLFAREFARSKSKVLSPYDAMIGTADIAPESARTAGPDPVLDRSVPALTSAFVGYARDELNYHTDVSYRLLNGEISRNWDYGTSRQGYAGVMNDLQRARSLNPALGVVIVNGYTDLVTPYLASRYLVNQVPTLAGAKPIRVDVLDGGHMMYFRPDGRRALKAAAAELYQATQ